MVLLNIFSLQKKVLTGVNELQQQNNETNNTNNETSSLPADISSVFTSFTVETISPNPSSSFSFPNVDVLAFNSTSALAIDQASITTEEVTSSQQLSLPSFEMFLGTFTYLLIIGITILGFDAPFFLLKQLKCHKYIHILQEYFGDFGRLQLSAIEKGAKLFHCFPGCLRHAGCVGCDAFACGQIPCKSVNPGIHKWKESAAPFLLPPRQSCPFTFPPSENPSFPSHSPLLPSFH
jgi:hypothetical protein